MNPFIEFRNDFPKSIPLYIIGEYTYERLPYELQKCYTLLPKTVEPIIPYDELEERGIPYSDENTYEIKREYRALFDEAMQELGLNQQQTVQPNENPLYPQMAPTPLQEQQQTPYLNGVERERTQEAGKRRSKKSKRKSRKSKKSKRKSRKYRKH